MLVDKKKKISYHLLLFVHQQLYIAGLLFVWDWLQTTNSRINKWEFSNATEPILSTSIRLKHNRCYFIH